MASSHKCLFLTFLFIALVLIQGRPAEKDMFSTAKEASLMTVHINTIIPIGACGEIKDCNQKCIELEYLGGSCVTSDSTSTSESTCVCQV
ncbi:hypothetical protein ISN44_As06g042630 [Arabidopsis suecica]|uniref:Uncharacterized protein n=1 Tax=Arabidopsis suecica TaxID=45249 RepID=A0A8T2CKY6_ARASU|nr:hypothetical protein ISN44_As06g042630 [Arabidopsis suecica]